MIPQVNTFALTVVIVYVYNVGVELLVVAALESKTPPLLLIFTPVSDNPGVVMKFEG